MRRMRTYHGLGLTFPFHVEEVQEWIRQTRQKRPHQHADCSTVFQSYISIVEAATKARTHLENAGAKKGAEQAQAAAIDLDAAITIEREVRQRLEGCLVDSRRHRYGGAARRAMRHVLRHVRRGNCPGALRAIPGLQRLISMAVCRDTPIRRQQADLIVRTILDRCALEEPYEAPAQRTSASAQREAEEIQRRLQDEMQELLQQRPGRGRQLTPAELEEIQRRHARGAARPRREAEAAEEPTERPFPRLEIDGPLGAAAGVHLKKVSPAFARAAQEGDRAHAAQGRGDCRGAVTHLREMVSAFAEGASQRFSAGEGKTGGGPRVDPSERLVPQHALAATEFQLLQRIRELRGALQNDCIQREQRRVPLPSLESVVTNERMMVQRGRQARVSARAYPGGGRHRTCRDALNAGAQQVFRASLLACGSTDAEERARARRALLRAQRAYRGMVSFCGRGFAGEMPAAFESDPVTRLRLAYEEARRKGKRVRVEEVPFLMPEIYEDRPVPRGQYEAERVAALRERMQRAYEEAERPSGAIRQYEEEVPWAKIEIEGARRRQRRSRRR